MNALPTNLTQKLSNHPEVVLAYLFGSQAKGHASKKSDVDIAILLKEPLKNPLQAKLELLGVLQEGVAPDIDLTLLNHAGSVLKYQVIKYGKLICEKKPGAHRNFRISVWKEYFDFQPTLDFFYRRKIA